MNAQPSNTDWNVAAAVASIDTEVDPGAPDRRRARYLTAAILLCLMLHAAFVFVQRVNWDEYYFLALIHEFQRGELTKALQTFHVYPFFWLTMIADHELTQVEVGRLCMLAMFSGTCLLIYASARAFASRAASAFAVLAFVSMPDVIVHGASFRADPMAAFLTMTSVAILAKAKLDYRSLLVAGFALAIAMLVTIKVVLLAPTLIALAILRWFQSSDRDTLLRHYLVSAICSAALFAALYFMHQYRIGFDEIATSKQMVQSAAQTTLVDHDLIARKFLFRLSYTSPAQIVVLLLAVVAAILVMLQKQRPAEERILAGVLLAVACPIISVFFYRNAFPYFYPFILPPAMIMIAWWVDRVGFGPRLLAAVAAVMMIGGMGTAWLGYYRGQDMQQVVIQSVHDIFPEPVHYIDRNSMIASFPKRGIFMSTWGLTAYAEAGQPIYKEILAKDVVPLLLLNSQALNEAVGYTVTNEPIVTLLEPDRQILRDNYIAHSGPIWVAGKRLHLGPTGQKATFMVPGSYTLEAEGGILFDGKPVSPGSTIRISRGTYILQSAEPKQITLRWGRHILRPVIPKMEYGLYGKM
jgi:hypothetical protein